MSAPDFDSMSKDEIVEWFVTAGDGDLAEVVRTAQPVRNTVAPQSGSGDSAIPLLLTSIRLPVDLVAGLDEVAAAEGTTRSEVIRLAVAALLRQRRGEVSGVEAEQALEVFKRLVREHVTEHRHAA